MFINSNFQAGAGICGSGRWASSLRRRFFGLYRNELGIISVASPSLGTESKEVLLQRLVDLLDSSEYR